MQRRYRLRHRDDFQHLRREGTVYRHSGLTLSVAPGPQSHNRYGVITAKYLGNAVTRNRVRRQLREAARLLHPRLQQGYDLVIIARPDLIGKPFTSIQRILSRMCERAGLLSEDS